MADYPAELVKDADDPNAWRVEKLDADGDGGVHVTIFSGPDARERADQYATWHRHRACAMSALFGLLIGLSILMISAEAQGNKSQGFEDQPKVVMALNRVYERPEDDPEYANKVIAGIVFVAGVIGLAIFVLVMERRIRCFQPPKPGNDGSRNSEDR